MSVWVVLNPVKVCDVRAFQDEVARVVSRLGAGEVSWLFTSVEEPGAAQGREAVVSGASVVIAVGGDGTVRSVAAGVSQVSRVVGRRVVFGIIPSGTGNVLARNLGIPRRSVGRAVELIVGDAGRTVPLDLAWLCTCESDVEYPFLSLAGAGFDGETMLATSSQWKARVGWLAYVVGAWKSKGVRSFATRIRLLSPSGEELRCVRTRAKSVVVSNIGRLPLMYLAPAANYSDGRADVAMVNTRAGLLGWMVLGLRLAAQYVHPWKTRRLSESVVAEGVDAVPGRCSSSSRVGRSPRWVSSLEYAQACRVRVELSEGRMVEVDGDPLHVASAFEVRIDHHALWVRVPRL